MVRLDVKSMIILAYLASSMMALGASESIACDSIDRPVEEHLWRQVPLSEFRLLLAPNNEINRPASIDCTSRKSQAWPMFASNFRPTSQSHSRPSWLCSHARANHLLARHVEQARTWLPSSGHRSRADSDQLEQQDLDRREGGNKWNWNETKHNSWPRHWSCSNFDFAGETYSTEPVE